MPKRKYDPGTEKHPRATWHIIGCLLATIFVAGIALWSQLAYNVDDLTLDGDFFLLIVVWCFSGAMAGATIYLMVQHRRARRIVEEEETTTSTD